MSAAYSAIIGEKLSVSSHFHHILLISLGNQGIGMWLFHMSSKFSSLTSSAIKVRADDNHVYRLRCSSRGLRH